MCGSSVSSHISGYCDVPALSLACELITLDPVSKRGMTADGSTGRRSGCSVLRNYGCNMLEAWLEEFAKAKKGVMDFGLERCAQIAKQLDLVHWNIPVIVVAGTNGKGSVLAALDAIYEKSGYRRLLYTSPHLMRFNERIRLSGVPVADDVFMEAVSVVDAARDGIPLTFFEWATLAALWIAKSSELDVLLLEVGLGGRLDTVNVVESDVAVITSIALDHTEYLGDTRELIAAEKAGIFRQGKPVVCGEPDIPAPIIEKANELDCPLFCYGRDYDFNETVVGSASCLKGENIATALQVSRVLNDRLPVTDAVRQQAIKQLRVPGRVEHQTISGREFVFDVAHNPQAVEFLAKSLKSKAGRTWAVYSALAAKDVAGMVTPLLSIVDEWLVPQLVDFRAAPLLQLQADFTTMAVEKVSYFPSVEAAVAELLKRSAPEDRCLVFGSFVTVGAVQTYMESHQYESLT
jgi:dihydrofolate synthase / folylpolyglutamate synthase